MRSQDIRSVVTSTAAVRVAVRAAGGKFTDPAFKKAYEAVQSKLKEIHKSKTPVKLEISASGRAGRNWALDMKGAGPIKAVGRNTPERLAAAQDLKELRKQGSVYMRHSGQNEKGRTVISTKDRHLMKLVKRGRASVSESHGDLEVTLKKLKKRGK